MTGNDITRPHMTGSDLEVTSFDWKSPGSDCRRPISQVLVGLSPYRAATRRRCSHVTGNDITRPHMTGSDTEVI